MNFFQCEWMTYLTTWRVYCYSVGSTDGGGVELPRVVWNAHVGQTRSERKSRNDVGQVWESRQGLWSHWPYGAWVWGGQSRPDQGEVWLWWWASLLHGGFGGIKSDSLLAASWGGRGARRSQVCETRSEGMAGKSQADIAAPWQVARTMPQKQSQGGWHPVGAHSERSRAARHDDDGAGGGSVEGSTWSPSPKRGWSSAQSKAHWWRRCESPEIHQQPGAVQLLPGAPRRRRSASAIPRPAQYAGNRGRRGDTDIQWVASTCSGCPSSGQVSLPSTRQSVEGFLVYLLHSSALWGWRWCQWVGSIQWRSCRPLSAPSSLASAQFPQNRRCQSWFPRDDAVSVVYLESYDELRRVSKTCRAVLEGGQHPWLVAAMLGSPQVSEFEIRHLVGKAIFAMAFRRPTVAILEEIFVDMGKAATGTVRLAKGSRDEVLCIAVLLPLLTMNLRAPLDQEVTITDASPTGGGGCVAHKFKEEPDLTNHDGERCYHCDKEFTEQGKFPCPTLCGAALCGLECQWAHKQGNCPSHATWCPSSVNDSQVPWLHWRMK